MKSKAWSNTQKKGGRDISPALLSESIQKYNKESYGQQYST